MREALSFLSALETDPNRIQLNFCGV